jgi:hypothetical protein
VVFISGFSVKWLLEHLYIIQERLFYIRIGSLWNKYALFYKLTKKWIPDLGIKIKPPITPVFSENISLNLEVLLWDTVW